MFYNMFYNIFPQMAQLWRHLKVTFLWPVPFTSISGIMRYQATIFTHLVLRLNASQADFEQPRRRPALGISKQPLAYVWTLSKWIAILTGFLAYFSCIPVYSRHIGLALGVEHFDTLILTNSLTLLLGEYLWWSQLAPLLGSRPRNDALNLLYDYSAMKVPSGLTKPQEHSLILSFNRQHTAVSRYCGLTILANLLPLPAFIWKLVSVSAGSGHTFFTCLFLWLNISLQGSVFYFSSLHASSQAFLFLRLFKLKLAHALSWLRVVHLAKFTCVYLRLHGELRRYNVFLSAFFFTIDMVLKLPGAFILVGFGRAGLLTTNFIALSSLLSCLVGYLVINGCFTAFAVFPQANQAAYKRLSGLYVQTHLEAKFGERATKQRQTWAQRVRAQRPVNVRLALSANGLLQFLASRQFGFTYGRLFLIEKGNVFENVLATIGYFLLFIKRRI